MIPPFEQNGNLPPGIHEATWEEVVARFGTNDHRRNLLDGLRLAIKALQQVGCTTVYLNGSFVTTKELPNDYDGTWEMRGVDMARLDPVFSDISKKRAAQKKKYGGELFPCRIRSNKPDFLDFFQRDKVTEQPKGIVAIDIRRFK